MPSASSTSSDKDRAAAYKPTSIDGRDSSLNPAASPASKTAKRTIHGLPVTTVELAGNYAGMDGSAKQGYRMLGAIIENPGGNIFLKFAGPAKTIAANQAKYDQLLASFDKDH